MDPVEVPIALGLTVEERRWYVWLTRELLNAVRTLCTDGTDSLLMRVTDELDGLVDELLGRIPDRDR